MKSFPEKFVEHFSSLYEEYKYVKKAIILAENLDPDRKILIAPLNQLRSALDHAFKATVITDKEQIGHELNEFREHVRRAGYDAFEVLSSILGLIVINEVKKYSNKALSTTFPDYYTTIKPQLIQMKSEIAEIRSDKDNHKKPFINYIKQLNVLIEILKKMDSMIPSLEEFERKEKQELEEIRLKEKKESKKALTNQIIVGLSMTIVGGLIGWFVASNTSKSSEKPITPERVIDSTEVVVDNIINTKNHKN